MKERTERFDVGVIVGRFQVSELHSAHRALIDHVASQHDKVVIVLGLSPLFVTRENPLDFQARQQMLAEAYPEITVAYIKDVDSDRLWSKRLDEIIADVVHPGQSAVLYGGRDSFVEHYSGKLPVRELEQTEWVSGSEIRRGVARAKTRASGDFRAGVVWAAYARYPTAYPTVDVAILRYRTKDAPDGGRRLSERVTIEVLLVRKPAEPLFRFVGGFAEPHSECFEDDARREVREETGVEIADLKYIGSARIDDWRYRPENDQIKTLFFRATHVFGSPNPQDDEIAEARWFPLAGVRRTDVMPAHRGLLRMLRRQLEQESQQRTTEVNR
jgi:bifunctional NMN adenylyltransferase/nudix hydrolase